MKWPVAADDAPLSMSFGDSRIGNLPPWVRHIIWWTISGCLVAVSFSDTEPIDVAESDPSWRWIVLVATLGGISLTFLAIEIVRGIEHHPIWQSLSRALVSIAFIVGVFALLLTSVGAQAFRCIDEECPSAAMAAAASSDDVTESESDDVGDSVHASPRNLVELLAWNTVDVIPAVDLTEGVEWGRPATSSDPFIRAAAFILRIFTIVVVIGALSRLWKRASRPWDRPITHGDIRAAGSAAGARATADDV